MAGEVEELRQSDVLMPGVLDGMWLCAAASLALFYQLSVVVCTTRNSALATSITGNVKDVFATTLGWLVFGGYVVRARVERTRMCGWIPGLVLTWAGTWRATRAVGTRRPSHAHGASGAGKSLFAAMLLAIQRPLLAVCRSEPPEAS